MMLFSRRGLARAVVLVSGMLGGCAGEPEEKRSTLDVALDGRAPASARIRAFDELASAADTTTAGPLADRLSEVVWAEGEKPGVRAGAIRSMLEHEATREKARVLGKRLLPREEDPEVVRVICEAVAANDWQDYRPSLVRRVGSGADELRRPAADALRALAGGQGLEAAVLAEVVNPGVPAGPSGERESVRGQAWALLSTLVPDRARRAAMLESAAPEARGDGAAVVEALRRAWGGAGVMPETGSELAWLVSLSGDEHRAWWDECSRSLGASSHDRSALALRHLEPARIAARSHAAWLTTPREELLRELASRVQGRKAVTREWKGVKPYREDLASQAERLSAWDVIAILLIDEALADARTRAALAEQVRVDRRDAKSEYGGLLMALALDAPRAVPVLFPPRANERQGDYEFVAPRDMLRADRALAHYHFHGAKGRSDEYAGPSEGDLAYAEMHRRTCLVLTSVRGERLAADCYLPGNVVIDLGVLGTAGE